MKFFKSLLYLVVIFCPQVLHTKLASNQYNVGLAIVATGKYVTFVEPLIRSAEQHFLNRHHRFFFVFTDHVDQVIKQDNVIVIYQKKLGWPYDSMMRCSMYYNARVYMKDMDFLYACDSDMRFVDTVGDEILGDLVATQHPGYIGNRGTYETNQKSLAYIAPHEGTCYFAGGFYGGKRDEFLLLNKTLNERIQADLYQGIMPVWHDESHLNRYLIDHKPTVILTPSYCYPESWKLNYHPRLIALDKNHAEIRSQN